MMGKQLDDTVAAPATLGARIAYGRAQRGLTQAQLAYQVGVTVAVVSRWENGHTRPDAESLRALCCRLRISADWLLNTPPFSRQFY